jgi:hypothetical protein
MQRHSKNFTLAWLLMLGVAGLSGCGASDPRQQVSGKVTLKGQPLDEGIIEFQPLSETGSTKQGSLVKTGDYLIPKDAGLLPGKYKVMITAGDSQAPQSEDEIPGPTGNYVMKDRIPPEFNSKSKLEVEVAQSGKNVFDFTIP